MTEEGERIRIPIEALDAPAYGPDRPEADDDDADRETTKRPVVDAEVEYRKFLQSVFSGKGGVPPTSDDDEEVLDTLEKLEAAGKIAPRREFKIDPEERERRLQEALAAPPPPVDQGPEAYVPVGGDAVDLKTATKMGLLPGDDTEEDDDVSDGGPFAPNVVDTSDTVTVYRELFEALKEVFYSIEAIPVEGVHMQVEEFNEAMDRQARARERVRELLRGER